MRMYEIYKTRIYKHLIDIISNFFIVTLQYVTYKGKYPNLVGKMKIIYGMQ